MKIKIAVFLSMLSIGLLANAQTVTVTNGAPGSVLASTNPPGSNIPIIGSLSPATGQLVNDAVNFFTVNADLFTNNMIGVEVFGLYAPQGKATSGKATVAGVKQHVTSYSSEIGGGFDVQIPLSNFSSTNSDPSALLSESYVGFGVFDFGGDFYDVNATFGIGNNFNVPIIGTVYGFVEAGPGKNLSSGSSVIGTSFAGAKYRIPLEKFWSGGTNVIVTVGGAYGTITDIHGSIYSIGGSVIFPLSKLGDLFSKL
jgi:hypothetical protein